MVASKRPVEVREVRGRWHTAQRITSSSSSARGWLADVLAVVDRLDTEFTLEEVYAHSTALPRLHPKNRHVRPKIRQQLQVARDLGVIEFQGNGRYRKTEPENPSSSLTTR
jgi:type II restriction enzyme